MENQKRGLHLERLAPEDWVIVGVATLLVLDLLALPWFSFGATISVGSDRVSIGGSLKAVDAPDAWLGVLAVLSCAFLITDLAFERLWPEARLPSIASDRETTRYILACVAAGLIGLKFLLHLGRFGELALGFWTAVLLVAGLVALTRRARQATSVAAPPTERPATSEATPEPGSSV